jgi:hypothetical protein
MKNIHVLTTGKPSRLLRGIEGIRLFEEEVSPDNGWCVNVNICITSDEEIKEGDPRINNYQRKLKGEEIPSKKIILTTDQDLIKDGVQAIDDEFLEWFVKNPSCEEVKVEDYGNLYNFRYLIMIPKEETKKLFTDYPITELGDEEFKEAPIRECELLFYDDNKYCYVKVKGIEKEIKRAYIYTKPGRCGEVDCISIDEINKLIEVNKQKQHLIDIMEGDEELGLYEQIDQNNPVTKGSTALVKEIKLEDVFNDKKREGAKQVIHQHKVLKGLSLVNPAHLQMTSNGHGEFPDGYKLTEKGIQYIIEQLNKE